MHFIQQKTLFICTLVITVLATCTTSIATQPHKPITNKLISLLDDDPSLKAMLETSLRKAKKINPNLETNPAQNLEDYYDFIDEAVELIPQVVLNHPKNLIREQILQSICYFYFLVNQPLVELEGKDLFNNTIQYYTPFSNWLREFADGWGQFLSTEASWNTKVYNEFRTDKRFGFQYGWYGSTNKWDTFNSFFSRYLVSPNVRPIASPHNEAVVSSPADSVPQGVWEINSDSKILIDDGLKVKLVRFFSVVDLVGKDSKYKDAFAGGTVTHSFLNVNDYHRYHFPVGGITKEVQRISQNVSLEVAWNTETGKYDPIDSMGWQFSQTRGVVIIETERFGLVALIPMGMAQVSSVNFEDDVKTGEKHKKGDMLGSFLFGGSDFVMVFQKQAGFKLTALKNARTVNDPVTYKHILMGGALGKVSLSP